ncbi:metal ABC transporter solute-binding protein, Zn/Mn family [Dialister sp.]|uniref:metal ABC transporter solute-binding protein, Zn/Mn family n=1 Tax=Dialister sp. TaxID=1955814 RepID=UPI002E806774|nr:zinc ABC transporter substrate-binding protein [Dialister sp.]MEE3453648.1 zinc ABC transporter substrate-binding protein [Dialister sp.]
MKKYWKYGILSLALLLSACGHETPPPSGKIAAAASFGAMEILTKEIGGNLVDVTSLVPAGTEPHDFEPRTKDLIKIKNARLFVYNGMGMEHWADKVLSSASHDNLIIVEASKGIQPIPIESEEERAEHGDYDPHTWLGLSEAKEEARAIRDGLISASPENRETFEKNYLRFAAEIDEIRNKARKSIAGASRKELVTGHAAFAYLARDLNLSQESVEDAFATGEPPARKLIELMEYCKARKVKTIFTEETMDPALARTLAEEAGARIETLDTMETADHEKYADVMRENVRKIVEAVN